MITCNLMGGLGNYMFQISAAHSVALENNVNSMFDFESYMKVHEDINTYRDNIFRNLEVGKIDSNILRYYENSFKYNMIPYSKNIAVCIDGYFQSEKYFLKYNKQIKQLFSEPQHITEYIDSKYGDIFENTCSIHVRRGDYKGLQQFHPLMTMEYYNKSIENFNGKFLVFSDDIDWCKENFIGDSFVFLDNEKDYIDLYLMARCSNNIIANSSFSWWGAWLNNNPNKRVIAPLTWFGPDLSKYDTSDLLPKDWILC